MRIHRIEMTGFGPFRQTQTVDFEAFDDHGIFLITGRTGAGKSSILDAIVYALYDSAPRYGNSGGRQVRSDHCAPDEPTRVELIFSAAGQTYRVVRQPEYQRPKSRGDGFTTQKAQAELSRRDDDQWVGIASQLRVVGEELHRILPLSCDQFLQVVLLAQGQFQKFLVASSDERQKLLRTLFRSDRFTDYDAVMQRRAGALRKELQLAESGIASSIATLAEHARQDEPNDPDEEWLSGVLDAHDTDVDVAKAELEQADKELDAAQDALHHAEVVVARQRRFALATANLTALLAERDQIDHDRERRDRGLAAQSVAVAHRARRAAGDRVSTDDTKLSLAQSRFTEVVGTHPPSDLPAHCDELKSDLTTLQSRLADEQRLEQVRAEAESLRDELTALLDEAERLTAECGRHQSLLDTPLELTVERAEHLLDGLRGERQQAEVREQAQRELEQEQVEEARCTKDLASAATTLASLQERRLANFAGTLAQELRDGEACAVCGGIEHPAPAVLADEVTADMLQEAQAALADATTCARTSNDRVVALRTTVESLESVRPLDDLRELVERAERDLESARRAELERERAQAACDRLNAQSQQLDVRRAQLEQGIEHADAKIAELATEVERARGTSGSVVERIEIVTGHIAATSGLIAARAAVASAQEQFSEADRRFQEVLDEQEFADEESFEAARLDEPTLRDLTARVEKHDHQYAIAMSTLAEPELQDLPTEPVDVEGPRAVHAQAKAVCDAASKRFGSVEARARTTHQLAATIRAGWAATAGLRADSDVLDRLARSLHGESPNTKRMRLESFVLAVELDQIVQAANGRLQVMSSGRYVLLRSDEVASRGTNAGLEVQVRDEYTGQTRPPQSLSGGEKFLASLALALGLAEVVTNGAGGITLDTLFIDEGFGSLDAETLDIAMQELDALRETGRTIGLISHVETMKERIPAQLAVAKTPAGCSTVEVLV